MRKTAFPIPFLCVLLLGVSGCSDVAAPSRGLAENQTLAAASNAAVAAAGESVESPAASPTTGVDGPKLVVDEPIFNFKSMQRNEVRSHQFKLRNEGDAPLVMSEMAASCKCLSMQLSSTELAPGASAVLRVEWRGAESETSLTQRVRIRTNDPDREIFEFTVLGAILETVSVTPRRIDLPPLRYGQPYETQIVVSSPVWTAFQIDELTSTVDGAELEVEPVESGLLADLASNRGAAPKSARRIRCRLPEGVVQGEVSGEITFVATPSTDEADGEEPLSMRVAINGELQRQITISGPGAIEDRLLKLGRVDRNRVFRKKFLVKVNDDQPELVVRASEIRPEYLSVDLRPYRKGDRSALYQMELVVPAGVVEGALMGEKQGQIHFEFEHPRVRELTLAVELAPKG